MIDTTALDNQNIEFDALEKLIQKYNVLTKVAVVDDDYPEVRHTYEAALRDFITALRINGRIPQEN